MAQKQQGLHADSMYRIAYAEVGYQQRDLFRQWLKLVDSPHVIVGPVTGDGRAGGFVYNYGASGGEQRLPVEFLYYFTENPEQLVIGAQPTVSANLQQMNSQDLDWVRGIEMTVRAAQVTTKNIEHFGTAWPVIEAMNKIVSCFDTFLGLRPSQAGLVRQSQMDFPAS